MVFTVPEAKWSCPEWVREALAALRPPTAMTVSEWAEKNLVLSPAESSKPGPYKVGFTEYMREIMNDFRDPEIEEQIVVKPSQVGFTRAMLNMIAAALDLDPAPMMVVYPTDDVMRRVALGRIKPMMETTPCLAEKYDRNSELTNMQFTGGISLTVASANSPASLASHHIRDLFLDEEEKYPRNAGKEASPTKLAIERTKTYRDTRKIVRGSTVVYEDGPIWRAMQTADTLKMCFVTCPHCGASWTFRFKQLQFNAHDEQDARKNAVYVCEACGVCIDDRQKDMMVKRCEWRVTRTNGSKRRTAYWFNTFYSPYVTLGDIAGEFVHSRKYPELLQNFVNSWLAEPYKDIEDQCDAEYVMNKRQSRYAVGEVPSGTVVLTGGVDVQRKCWYWTVTARRLNMAGYNVAHGKAYSWAEVHEAMNREYFDNAGKPYQVNLAGIDSGDQTDEVYTFCAANREWAIPVKGASNRLDAKYTLKRIDKAGTAYGTFFVRVDTEYYKDMLSARLRADEESGGFYVYEGCDPEYCEMITSEQKVVEREGRRLISHWRQKQSGRDNHYWDCEVYAACAADLVGLRRMAAQAAQSTVPVQEQQPGAVANAAAPVVDARPQRRGYFDRQRRRY